MGQGQRPRQRFLRPRPGLGSGSALKGKPDSAPFPSHLSVLFLPSPLRCSFWGAIPSPGPSVQCCSHPCRQQTIRALGRAGLALLALCWGRPPGLVPWRLWEAGAQEGRQGEPLLPRCSGNLGRGRGPELIPKAKFTRRRWEEGHAGWRAQPWQRCGGPPRTGLGRLSSQIWQEPKGRGHCEEEAVPGTLAPCPCGPRATDGSILPKPAGELQHGVRVCGADPRAGL